ncbi:hypothetical protein FB192DRAFT_1383193 [Mucor lusitanicus]|uniref:Uncharacterized protein n=1 Tax=Mucor circinelloides f. lusitanicus TaxID=29924 RepID=A0A8H4BF30_MUCCL|nr:hypothetical protein FB192DRAFT_1383193 [Mucor lusitanicus]
MSRPNGSYPPERRKQEPKHKQQSADGIKPILIILGHPPDMALFALLIILALIIMIWMWRGSFFSCSLLLLLLLCLGYRLFNVFPVMCGYSRRISKCSGFRESIF